MQLRQFIVSAFLVLWYFIVKQRPTGVYISWEISGQGSWHTEVQLIWLIVVNESFCQEVDQTAWLALCARRTHQDCLLELATIERGGGRGCTHTTVGWAGYI